MASVRELKKDIDHLMSMVISDCFYVLEVNEKVNREAVMDLAQNVIQQHREFRKRVNHPDGKENPKLVKKYYNKLADEVLKTAHDDLEKLSKEVKKAS